jgi:hypothetical protein
VTETDKVGREAEAEAQMTLKIQESMGHNAPRTTKVNTYLQQWVRQALRGGGRRMSRV